MIEAGLVLETNGTQATVRMTRTAACAECGLCQGFAHPTRDLVLSAGNPRGARKGDLVRVQIPDIGVVRAAFWAYGVPTLSALAGGALGWAVGAGAGLAETWASAGGLIGVVAGFYIAGRYDRRLRSRWKGPVIVEVLSRSGSEGDAC